LPEGFSIAPIEAFLIGAPVFAVIGILFYFGENYKRLRESLS